jgi:predicted metal-dependent hydrolase
MTLGVTRWLVEDRVKLFAGADTRVVSFVLWHMVEEDYNRLAIGPTCFPMARSTPQ